MGYIYKITNLINNCSYVGQTSRPLKVRWKEHVVGKPRQSIDFAIKKYGKTNFSLEVLEKCNNELLNDREQYWINYYDTFNNGYNNTKGGQLYQSTCLSQEEINYIIEQWYKTDLCLTRFHKYVGHGINTVKNYLLLNGISQEEINSRRYNQILKSKKRKKKRPNNKIKSPKPDFQETNILQDFQKGHGLTFLAKKYHKTISSIRKILLHKNISIEEMNNHKWYDRTNKKWKTIYCYDLNGNFLKKYPTREDLLKEYNLKELKLIHNCCSGLKKTSLGKKWSYMPLTFSEEDIKKKEKKCEKYDENNILITCYNSIKECSEKNNISKYKINNSNKNNTYYNHFRYKILS